MNVIEKLPLPVSGLVLALFSLGNLVQDVHPYLRYLFGSIGGIFLVLILLKLILYPETIRRDLKNPIILSSFGTFPMAVMLLSTYLNTFMPAFSHGVWIIGIGLHILLMIYFTYRFVIREFDIKTVYPSWWIVYIGITMGAITANVHGLNDIDFIFFMIGFISMLVTTPVVFYRYIRYPNNQDMNKPLICIFTALFSILIVGYLNSAESVSYEFAMGLYLIACIFYIFALYKFIDYRNIDFYPSFAAFTFPFVISALATKGIVGNVASNMILDNILIMETAIALILVIYVLAKYAVFLKK